jgi:beta-lactamase regulating signal transducer with metallopeptidase domain
VSVLNALLEITVYSAVIYLGIWLFGLLFKGRLSARLKYALWFLLVFRLLLPVTLASPVHLITTPQPQKAASSQGPAAPAGPGAYAAYEAGGAAVGSLPAAEGNAPVDAEEPSLVGASAPAPAPAPLRVSWPGLLLGAWIAGAAGMLLYYAALAMRLRRRIRAECHAAPEDLRNLMDRLCGGMGLRGRPEMLIARTGGSPCLTASLRPKLLLPEAVIQSLDGQQIEFAIGHELAHYRRKDYLASLLMNLLRCVHWFNPVVWLAARGMNADMEAACDSDFVRLLGDEDRRRYAQTLLALFNRGGSRSLALGMAAGARKAAERRIRALFLGRRSGRGARCAAAALALVMLFACFTTACRPTPSKPAVAGKDGDRLEEIIKATKGAGNAQTPAPSEYKDTFKGADDTVTVDIDAAVTQPDGAMPVIEVRPRAVTTEQVKAMAQVLFKGETAYEPAGMTRSDIQDEIVNLRRQIADDAALLKYFDGDRDAADLAKAEYQKQAASYEAMLPSAPETAARKETDWAFHPDSYYTGSENAHGGSPVRTDQYFIANGMLNDYHTFIQAGNIVLDDYESHFVGFTLGKDMWEHSSLPKWRYAEDKPGNMTRNEAVALAAEALGRMGLGNMKLVSCKAEQSPKIINRDLSQREALSLASTHVPRATEPPEGEACSYAMTFVPVYEGIPVLATGQNVERDQFGPAYSYESLFLRVRDGLVTDLEWRDPMETVRVENADVTTLSFGQALDAFRNHMQMTFTLDHLAEYTLQPGDYGQYKGRVESGSVTITDIRLGLMRVRVKDRLNAYRLVPAWMFMGSEQLKINGIETPVAGMRSEEGLYAYAVINAVDGSVIDPALGY